jgi:hypothetical protein
MTIEYDDEGDDGDDNDDDDEMITQHKVVTQNNKH